MSMLIILMMLHPTWCSAGATQRNAVFILRILLSTLWFSDFAILQHRYQRRLHMRRRRVNRLRHPFP